MIHFPRGGWTHVPSSAIFTAGAPGMGWPMPPPR